MKNETSTILTGLEGNTLYQFTVKGFNSVGQGPASAAVTAKTRRSRKPSTVIYHMAFLSLLLTYLVKISVCLRELWSFLQLPLSLQPTWCGSRRATMCLWVGTRSKQRKMSLMSSDTWWSPTCRIVFDLSMQWENRNTIKKTKHTTANFRFEFLNACFLSCRCYSNRRDEATTRWREPLTRPPCSASRRGAPISLRYAL